jgi:hypothetical protein
LSSHSQFLILSALWREYLNIGTISAPLALYTLLMTWFTLEYEYYDYVHLYTYDFIDENVGFKVRSNESMMEQTMRMIVVIAKDFVLFCLSFLLISRRLQFFFCLL